MKKFWMTALRNVLLENKRRGECLSREWVRSAGNETNDIFVPYYIQ